jgi:hypothetical protein
MHVSGCRCVSTSFLYGIHVTTYVGEADVGIAQRLRGKRRASGREARDSRQLDARLLHATSSTRRTWAVPAAFATMSHLGRCR